MLNLSDLQQGDVLVQFKGQPWVFGAKLFTSFPFPHSMMVTDTKEGAVTVIEDSTFGISERDFNATINNYTTYPLDHYEVWRPRCEQSIKLKAVEWARAHKGEGYNYLHLITILVLYRLSGPKIIPGMDDNIAMDSRKKICSELIAMSYYRSGYDLVPLIADSETLPWDLRNPVTCDFIGV